MQNDTMFQFFHWFYPREDRLWKDVVREAPRLASLGVTAVWLPPAYKASTGSISTGYDIYDLYDLGEFDQKGTVATRYGTRQEYTEAIKALHDHKITVLADIVFNHKAGADETEQVMAHKVNPDDRNEVISDDYEIGAFTKFTFPGRGDKYSAFKWDAQCFSGVDWDDNKKEGGVYKILNEYGDTWEDLLGDERGNFDYLMCSDIEFRNEAVRKELKDWALWYLDVTGVDGFRLDAVKHIAVSFFPEWLGEVRSKTGKELFAVGEYNNSLDLMEAYAEKTNGCMSLFDFPLQHRFHEASWQGRHYDLRTILDDTYVRKDPIHAVTFTDNHDSQAMRNNPSNVREWFRAHAYALILLREEGYPCVFHPDLYGFVLEREDEKGQKRQDRFKAEVFLEKLMMARKCYAYGMQRDYFVHPNRIGWTREGTDEIPGSGCAVLLSNSDEGKIDMHVGVRHAGTRFKELNGLHHALVRINEYGIGTFHVNARSVAVWVPAE